MHSLQPAWTYSMLTLGAWWDYVVFLCSWTLLQSLHLFLHHILKCTVLCVNHCLQMHSTCKEKGNSKVTASFTLLFSTELWDDINIFIKLISWFLLSLLLQSGVHTFIKSISVILHTLVQMFIFYRYISCFRYKSNVAKLIILQTSHCIDRNYFYCYHYNYQYKKILWMKHLMYMYIHHFHFNVCFFSQIHLQTLM